jgi:hypothetical protein
MMKRRPAPPKPWLCDSWQFTGVVVNSQLEPASSGDAILVRSSPEGDDYLWGGLSVRLHRDETESYYYNLVSERPSLYVISASDDQGVPKPFLVSACFDEANAYNEAGQYVDAVPMPPELYQWIEHYVLTHYIPEPRIKRKRRDWNEGEHEQR